MTGAIGGTQFDRGVDGMCEMRSGNLATTVQHRDRELYDQREQADGRRETAPEAGTRYARKNVHGVGQRSKRAAKRSAVKPPPSSPGRPQAPGAGDPSG